MQVVWYFNTDCVFWTISAECYTETGKNKCFIQLKVKNFEI